MDAFDVSWYPSSIMAYPDALQRTPSAAAPQGVQGVAATYAVPPVQSATAGPGGGQSAPSRRDGRPTRRHPYTPPKAYGPYALSFNDVLARYRHS